MEKRKRAPGGGRKPGRLGRLDKVMSLRLPAKLRKKLRVAAKLNDRPLSVEAITRLNDSFENERSELISQAIREIEPALDELSAVMERTGWKLGLKPKGKQ